MNEKRERSTQIKESAYKENINLEKVHVTQKQMELDLISELKYHSQALITFKFFEQKSGEQINKVNQLTKHFESLVEQSQSLKNQISELKTSANIAQIQIDSQIDRDRPINEQYNNLRSHCEQIFNSWIPLIQQFREQINFIDKSHICEVKSFRNPPFLLLKYLQILMKTLYNPRNLEYKNLIQYMQNPQKFLQEWLEFNIEKISHEKIRDIRAGFNPDDEQILRNISQFGYCIFCWCKTIVQVHFEFQAIQPAKEQLRLLTQNIQKIQKEIQEKEAVFTKIDNQLQQLNQQLTELNNLINQNQSQYDVQVVQRSAFQVLRKIIENFETRVRQLEDEIENVDILAFVESAYNQQFKKYESKECESKIGELAIPFALAKPIEYKLNYCYSNSKSSVVFVFDPYQVGRIIFEIMSQKAQSVCLSTSTEQQIVESSQIIHFINNQQELSQVIQRVNTPEKRQLFFIFERYLLEQLKQVSMDNYVNLDLNEQDLAYIYSNYSINQQYTIGLQRHNDKLKDQVNFLLNILNNNAFETNYQLFSDFKLNYKADWLSLQQFDEQFPLFCSKLFFFLQGKKKLQFTEMANSILNVYQTKPTTPMIYCFKYAFDYSIQYMALNQTLVHPFDDGSEQTLLGLLIHKASLNKEFELSEEEQQQLQKCYVFCCEFLISKECYIFELISEYIGQKQIYNKSILEVVQELNQVSSIFECISKQRESTKVLPCLIENNQNLKSSILKFEKEIAEAKMEIEILKQKISDNGKLINLKQNSLHDLDKKLANQHRNLVYSEINYLTHTADPDQLTFELFGLLMILIDKDSTWVSIKNNTNSKLKIQIINNYEIKKISKNFLDSFTIFTNDEQKTLQLQALNTQTQKLYKFLQTIRQKCDFYQEKIKLEEQLINCILILKQDNSELQKQQNSLTQQEKTLKDGQIVFQQNERQIQLEMNILSSLNNNLWFEDQIRQIHQNKESTLKIMNEKQVIICMHQSCEKQFKESFLRIQMKEEQYIEQGPLQFHLLNSEQYIDFLQNSQFALQFQANLNLKQLDLKQQYYQNCQILKFKLIQMIKLIEIDNLSQGYLDLFIDQQQKIIVKINQNIKMNIKKTELFTQPLLEFSAALAMILIQSHGTEYLSVLDFISKFIQRSYVNQTFSRNEFLKKIISSASTYVKVDNLGRLYIQIFILFIYIYQPGHVSQQMIAQSILQDYFKILILGQITPQDSLASIKFGLDNQLESRFGEDRFRFCDL